MLRLPRNISIEEKSEILAAISYAAKYPNQLIITEKSSKEDIAFANYLNKIIKDANIYQYSLESLPKSSIVLSNKVYKKLCCYAHSSNINEKFMTEFGGYIYGIEYSPNQVYFQYNNATNVTYGRKLFETSDNLCEEIYNVIVKTNCDCIAHVHTHPYINGCYSLVPSNQDLYVYAHLQENFNHTNREVYFLGGLITPLTRPDADIRINDLCFVFYDKKLQKFYKCDNIYYEDDNGKTIQLNTVDYQYRDEYTGKVLLKEKRKLLYSEINNK